MPENLGKTINSVDHLLAVFERCTDRARHCCRLRSSVSSTATTDGHPVDAVPHPGEPMQFEAPAK